MLAGAVGCPGIERDSIHILAEIGTMSVLRLRSRERVATISLFSRLLHQALQHL